MKYNLKKITGILICAALVLALIPVNFAFAASSFTTSNGSVIIEAEGANWTEAKLTNGYKGFEKKSDGNSNGGYYLRPHSYSGTSSSPSSLLSFTVTANESGRYNLWVRASSSASDGSAFWMKYTGVDWYREELSSEDSGDYTWVRLLGGYPMKKNASVTFNFAPKNVDSHIDCFIFTDKATFLPSGKVSSVSAPALSTSTYGAPTVTPISSHPRVMFNSTTLATIRNNYTASGNSRARTSFEAYRDAAADGTRPFSGATTTNWSWEVEYQIEADAFEYALNGTAANGQSAVTELINYLDSVTFDPDEQDVTRKMGSTLFHAAEVYDWCYDLLTTEQKNDIINQCEGIATGLETGYPPNQMGNVTGHSGESNILRDLLAFSIAVYNERPDIYNYVMGRIQNYMVPPRNDFYRSHSFYQGTSYGPYRLNYELYAYHMTKVATGAKLFTDDIGEVMYALVYGRRPDGKLFSYGDDAGIEWARYNAYAFRAMKMAADIFDNQIFKNEYYLMRGDETFNSSYCKDYQSFNAVRSLIMNNPEVTLNSSAHKNALPLSRYFGSPNGMILARTSWQTRGSNSNSNYLAYDVTTNDTAAALMKIGERYGANHDHLDAGSFQLYYKGLLASDSGNYNQDDYDASHNANYAKRTIAHNALTIYNSGETFSVLGVGTANDGGQLWRNEANNISIWTNGDYDRGTVLDHEIAADNSYSYIKGNITNAYSPSKANKVLRSMSFFPTDDDHFKAMMIIYDEVQSKSSSQTKKFLLHTLVEPTVSGSTVTVENTLNVINGSGGSNGSEQNGGRLTMKTLLPSSANITKVGGDGNEYSVNGTNYPPLKEQNIYDLCEAGWGRVEVKASTETAETDFLNVLAVSDAGDTTALSAELINESNVVGVKALGKAALFAKGASRIDEADFEIPGNDESIDITVFGLQSGRWLVYYEDNEVPSQYIVESEGGTMAFSGPAGAYTLEMANDLSDIPPVMNEGAAFNGFNSSAVEAVNSGNFTIQFTPVSVNQTNAKRSVSLIGDVKSDFAVYKLINSDEVYVKLPGTVSILKRAHLPLSDVVGAVNTLTFNSETRVLKWYIGNTLRASKVYPEAAFNIGKIPFEPWGGSVTYSSVKVYNFAFTSEEVSESLQ